MLAIFDVEGVLLDAEFLPTLAEKINKQDEIWDITRKGIEGVINWEEGLKKRIEILRGISYETCKEVADSLKIMTGAKETCRALKAAGWKLMVVSGGFTIVTDRLQDELDLDCVFANELIFKNGKLDDVKIHVDSDKAKSATIKVKEWKEEKKNITVVVDGANDVKLFDICGLGVAFRAQDIVKDLATITLEEKDLCKLIDLIKKHYGLEIRLQTMT